MRQGDFVSNPVDEFAYRDAVRVLAIPDRLMGENQYEQFPVFLVHEETLLLRT